MNAKELDALGRLLYEKSENQVKPTWDQIGDTTKGVWKDRVTTRERDYKAGWDAHISVKLSNPRETYIARFTKLLKGK